MKTLLRTNLFVFVLVVLTTTNCSQVEKVNSPEEVLLETLRQRFDDNEYALVSEVPKNPFEKQGEDAGRIFKKIRTTVTKHQKIRTSPVNQNQVFRLASFSTETATTFDKNETFGIESSEDLRLVSAILLEENKNLSLEKIAQTNEALKGIPLSDMGGLKILDNAVYQKQMSSIHRDLLILNYNKMAAAKSKEEIVLIANTFEKEVANSEIDENEKHSMLLNSAMVRHMVLENPEINTMKSLNTAFIVPFVVTILVPIVLIYGSYWMGRGIGSIFCDRSSAQYEECLDTFGGVAAMLASAIP